MKILTELNGKEFLLHAVSTKKQPEVWKKRKR